MSTALHSATTRALYSAAEIRRQRGYSLADLAETCGLTEAELSRIESGEDVTVPYLKRIAAALRCPLDTMAEYGRAHG